MIEEFFLRALIAGIAIALITGPLGCFIVWRRLAYFGDTLAHSALLGVALALVTGADTTLGVFVTSTGIAALLLLLQRRGSLSSDALLGLLAHASLAIGLVALAFMSGIRVDLQAFLFGDILAVSWRDILVILAGGTIVLAALGWIWKPLFAATVNRELAQAEGMRPDLVETIFMVLTAIVIAISLKLVGALLITALLIIPAATARHFATGPEQMAAVSIGVGTLAVLGGLGASWYLDTPSGPSIVVAAFILFLFATGSSRLLRSLWRHQGN